MKKSNKEATKSPAWLSRSTLAVLVVAAVFLMLLSVTEATAQSGSTNYKVASGALVAGAASSTSTNYKDVGAVPVTAGGVSSSSNFTVSGGVVPITFGTPAFTASYAGAAIETITKLDKVLKVSYLAGPSATAGTFYYRNGGATTYQMASMTAGAGDTLVYTVPASLLTVRGLEYYLLITQGSSSVYIGNQTDPYVFIVQLTDEQAQRPTSLAAVKYRIIGVPISFSVRNTVTTVFDELGAKDITKWRLFSYNTATDTVVEYPDAADVVAGRGYWMIMRNPVSYGAAGFSMRPDRETPSMDYYELQLDSGWNLVSNPFSFNIVWSEVRFDTGGVIIGHSTAVIDDSAYWFDGTDYFGAQTIPAWDGFFLLTKRAGVKILFPYHESSGREKAAAEAAQTGDPAAWNIRLKLEAGDFVDDGNFAGVRSDALPGEDDYDYSEPPPAPGAPRMAFRLPENAPRLRRADYRPPFTDGAVWRLEFSPGAGRAVTVTGLGRIPDGMQAVLVLDNGTSVQLTEGGRITLADKVTSARLLIGTKGYLDGEMQEPLPTVFTLDQNFPNPFNPLTTINFALPKPNHVLLQVFNILGQKVQTLVDEDLQAGQYVKVWNGEDDEGRPMASGIYFYRIETPEFIQCRKMMLLK